ncbi:helix-turn-helix domain-containing protein, partial [Staphylococcus hominis]|uniref:helix-turn-helix domain-containing protein n=1 Tax=Staphylococcus hominis TaxID=1290 RepID=UPI0011A73C49
MNFKHKILPLPNQLFIKNPYNPTTTPQILKLSQTTKPNLYYHFKTKQNLFLQILNIQQSKSQQHSKNQQIKSKTNTQKFYLYN